MNDQRVVRFETVVSKPKWYSVIASHIIKHSFLLKVIGFPLYYVSGVIFYTIKEGWTVLQATYFITVTITTCGYGFFHPTSDDSKLFTIFYIFFGLIIVFTVVSDISNSVLFDSQAEGIQFIHRHVNKYLGRGETQLSDASTRFYQLQFSLFSIFLLALIGALFFSSNENWSYLDAVYWTVCTMTTIGYGDLTIKYESTRVFAIFFIFGCVLIYATAARNIVEVYTESIKSAALQLQHTDDNDDFEKFNNDWIEKNFTPENGEIISKSKIILLSLIEMGIIDQRRDIKPILNVSTSTCYVIL